MNFLDTLKQKMWDTIYTFFPTLQKRLLRSGLLWHTKGRQKYHLGWLAPHKDLEGLKHHLHEKWGFGNHFVAWTDSEQVLSWRKLVDFRNQYHLRVFADGEIRGHFEFTPEAHPLDHFREQGEQNREGDFLKFLEGFVVKEKHISHLVMDPDATNPDSEVTVDR